ncbi:unnamed protein product [Cunninghamella blakesleeana]
MQEIDEVETGTESSSSPILHDAIPIVKSETERKFVKKLNWSLLPIIWAIIFVQYADKFCISGGVVLGMLEETHISLSQFSIIASIFFAGYISFQFPNAYLIHHFPTSKYLGSLLIIWGVVTSCTAACHNFSQLVVCRVLLGFFEAATYPCLFITLNAMYRRQEQSACLGFLWMSNSLGSILAAIITYGVARTIDGALGIHAWRWNFIIFGVMTVVVGIITIFFLIDHPHSKLLRLTEEEEKIVKERIQDNAVIKDKTVKVHHYWEALREPRYYLIMIAAIANNLSNGGLVIFSTPFVASLGFASLDAILLQMPSAAIAAIFIFVAVFIHQRTGKYYIAILFSGSIATIGCILLVVLPHNAIKLLGYYLAYAFNGSYVMLISIISSDVSGYSKKVFYNASLMVAYTIGCFVGPLLMLEHEAPRFRSGMIIFTFGNLIVVLCLLTSIYLMYRINKQRLAVGIMKTDAYLDLTDREDSNFIYKL